MTEDDASEPVDAVLEWSEKVANSDPYATAEDYTVLSRNPPKVAGISFSELWNDLSIIPPDDGENTNVGKEIFKEKKREKQRSRASSKRGLLFGKFKPARSSNPRSRTRTNSAHSNQSSVNSNFANLKNTLQKAQKDEQRSHAVSSSGRMMSSMRFLKTTLPRSRAKSKQKEKLSRDRGPDEEKSSLKARTPVMIPAKTKKKKARPTSGGDFSEIFEFEFKNDKQQESDQTGKTSKKTLKKLLRKSAKRNKAKTITSSGSDLTSDRLSVNRSPDPFSNQRKSTRRIPTAGNEILNKAMRKSQRGLNPARLSMISNVSSDSHRMSRGKATSSSNPRFNKSKKKP